MAAIDRGTKRRCANCGAAYYDLNRDPIVCPKCQAPFVAAPRPAARAARGRTIEPLPALPEEEAPAFAEDEILEHMDEDEDDLPPEAGGSDEHDDEARD